MLEVPYAIVSDVRSIVDSDVSDAEITNIIAWSDAVITMRLDVGALPAAFLELLSSKISALTIMLKDPGARTLGEYSENRNEALRLLKQEIDEYFKIGGGGLSFVAAMDPVV
jgi:hypothetical protein